MSRISRLGQAEQAEIKKHFLETELPKGRGAIKRTAEKFKAAFEGIEVTEAMVKGICIQKPEPKAQKANPVKTTKSKAKSKAKPKKAESEELPTMELLGKLVNDSAILAKIRAILG